MIFSFGSFIQLKNNDNHGSGKAFLYVDGELTQQIDLFQNKIILLENMVLKIENGGIQVSQSNCPYQLCKLVGRITEPYQTIICVPNKVLVEIENDSSDSEEYQVISY